MKDHSISLWQEFRTPFYYGFFVLLILLGIHNTFETLVVIDENLYLPKLWSSLNYNQSEKGQFHHVLERSRASNVNKNENRMIKSVSAITSASPESGLQLKKIQNENSESILESSAGTNYTVLDSELNLQAAEFFAPSVGKEIKGEELSGQLTVEDGKIKQIFIQINSDQYKELKTTSISITAAQLMGNVFQYSMDNENYSGTIHDIGEGETYLVSFMNGPFEGIRAKFMTNLPDSSSVQTENVNEINDQEITDEPDSRSNVVATAPIEGSHSVNTPGTIVNNVNSSIDESSGEHIETAIPESPPNLEEGTFIEGERNSPEQAISNDPSLVGSIPIENNQNPLNQDY